MGSVIQGRLKIWTENSHWFLLTLKLLQISWQKFQFFHNEVRYRFSPNLKGVAQKFCLTHPFEILDTFSGWVKNAHLFCSQDWPRRGITNYASSPRREIKSLKIGYPHSFHWKGVYSNKQNRKANHVLWKTQRWVFSCINYECLLKLSLIGLVVVVISDFKLLSLFLALRKTTPHTLDY